MKYTDFHAFRAARAARHMWIRDGLDRLESARREYRLIYRNGGAA